MAAQEIQRFLVVQMPAQGFAALPGLQRQLIGQPAAPGGFFVFGCLIALVNKISKGRAIKKKEFGCAGCPMAGSCGQHGEKEATK